MAIEDRCKDQHELMMAVLHRAGGKSAESLVPKEAPGRIADVVFDGTEPWVFEIKSLETNRLQDTAIQEKVGERLARDAAKFGGPVPFGTVWTRVDKLPLPTARNVMRIFGQSVADGLKTASKQIKSTKEKLALPHARGCLTIICPPHELDYEVMGFIVSDAFRNNRHSGVNVVLIAQTPVLAAFGNYKSFDSSLIPFSREGIDLPAELKLRIYAAWCELLELRPRGRIATGRLARIETSRVIPRRAC